MNLFLIAGAACSSVQLQAPPTNYSTTCVQNSCIFSETNNVFQGNDCGEVDASSRMPADIWDDSDAINEYVKATITLYSAYGQTTRLKQTPCYPGSQTRVRKGTKLISWTGEDNNFMSVTCDDRCHCKYPRCKDVPDDPKDSRFCSLCGPKFNAPINMTIYYPSRAAMSNSSLTAPAPAPGAVSVSGKSIVDLAVATSSLSTLVTALKAADLVTTLSGAGPFTVFAPTNAAFAALPAATLASLLDPKNKAQLTSVLTYHVLSGAVFSKDLKTFQMVKTVETDELTIVKAGRVIVNNATVISADNAASNGVVHIIDGVLIPPSTMKKNIVQLAQSVPDLSTLVKAVVAAKLATTLSGAGPFTVFAPTNEAFNKLPASTLASLLDPKNIKQLTTILTYHVLSGTFFAKDLNTGLIKTLEGDNLQVSIKRNRHGDISRVQINGATVTSADNMATNGAVHIIDAVLIPPAAPTPPPTPAPTPLKNIVQLAQSVPDLSTLVKALVAAKLTTTLSGAGPFTVFAPTNEAFNKLPASTLASLLDPKNIKQLTRVLTLHVLVGQSLPGSSLSPVKKASIASGGPGRGFYTVSGDTLFVVNDCAPPKRVPGKPVRNCPSSILKINPSGDFDTFWGTFDATVTSADNVATNGVVHIIDSVLIPPANDLFFRGVNPGFPGNAPQCGEVNAGPRIPAEMFEPKNAAVLKEYVDITIKLYPLGDAYNTNKLELGRCKDVGYVGSPVVNGLVAWAPPVLMDGICALKCKCNFPGATHTTLPACKDQPDDPKAGKWCSLCGPKYNEKISVVFRKKQ